MNVKCVDFTDKGVKWNNFKKGKNEENNIAHWMYRFEYVVFQVICVTIIFRNLEFGVSKRILSNFF